MRAVKGIFCILWLLCGCTAAGVGAPQPLLRPLTIVCTSDTHYQKDRLDSQVSIVPQMIYNEEILDAMFHDMLKQNPDYILLSGDMVNQGDAADHERFADKLRAVSVQAPVLAVPGNHDLTLTDDDQFLGYYHEFGYDQAFSRDTQSLSYAIRTEAGAVLVILDTNDHRSTHSSGAYVTLATGQWLEAVLQEAQSKGDLVITVSHHNLLEHTVTGSDIIESEMDLRTLLNKYGVRVHLSGHRHTGHIAEKDGLTEIVLPMPVAWPNSYGLIEISQGRRLHYQLEEIPVSAWAEEQSSELFDLMNFQDYSLNAARSVNDKTLSTTLKNLEISEYDRQMMEALFQQLSLAYRSGKLNEVQADLKEHPGAALWAEKGPASIWTRWVKGLLETPQLPGAQIEIQY